MGSAAVATVATTRDGASIAYRDFGGSGPVLLLLPGWSCTQHLWDPTVPYLGAYRVVTLDFAGFGASPAAARRGRIEEFAGDALAVLEVLGTDVTLVGHSMGGAVALETAALAPERVRRIVGCDSFTYPTLYEKRDEKEIDETLRPFRADFPQAVRSLMPAFLHPQGDPAVHALALDTMARADPARAVPALKHLLRWDLVDALRRCPVPVSTINAAGLLADDVRQRYAARIAIRTIDGVGHFLMMERPEAFAAALSEIAAPPFA